MQSNGASGREHVNPRDCRLDWGVKVQIKLFSCSGGNSPVHWAVLTVRFMSVQQSRQTCNVEYSRQPMRSVEVVTRRKGQFAVVLALAATCILGRMTFVAATAAFENPAPKTFQKLAGLWDVLRWSVPAVLIGTMVTRRVMTVAAAVSLIGVLGQMVLLELLAFVSYSLNFSNRLPVPP